MPSFLVDFGSYSVFQLCPCGNCVAFGSVKKDSYPIVYLGGSYQNPTRLKHLLDKGRKHTPQSVQC